MAARLESVDLEVVELGFLALRGDLAWPEVMREIDRRFGFAYSMITTRASGPATLGAGLSSSPPEAAREVLDRWWQIDTRTPRYLHQSLASPGQWVNDAHVYEAHEIARSPLHHDYLRPRGTSDFAGLAQRLGDTDYFFVAGIPVGDPLPGPDTLNRLGAALLPLMQTADLWVNRHRSQLIQDAAAAGLGRPVIAVDQQGRWSWTGPAARQALEGTLSITCGKPTFADRRPWTKCLSALTSVEIDAPPASVAIERTGAPPLVLVAHRVDVDPLDPFAAGDLLAILTLHDVSSVVTPPIQALEALGLTPAEARLAARVGRAMSPAGAAAELGVSLTTARGTLAGVYAKLGITRQAELVRLVTLLMH